jgi:hypothetical protein
MGQTAAAAAMQSLCFGNLEDRMRLAYALALAVPLAALGAAPGWAGSACPSGYRYQSAQGNCLSIVAPLCPTGFQANANRTQCVNNATRQTRAPTCPSGYQFRTDAANRGQCTRERAASCPSGQRVNTSTGECVVPPH